MSAARQIERQFHTLEEASVIEVTPGRIEVLTPAGTLGAARAASCLLEPMAGDTVLVSVGAGSRSYVIAVLERPGDEPCTISAPGDLALRARGQLSLEGARGLELTTTESAQLTAGTLDLRARIGSATFRELAVVAGDARAHLSKLSVVGEICSSSFERITARAKRVYRFIEELDQVRADHLDYRAETQATVRGKHTAITAREVIKIDGEQVHVG